MTDMLVFAHISDTHFDGGERAFGRARRVMAHLRGLPVDAILVSGDIAEHGASAEYEQARAELTADVPVLMLPGNHDDRSAYRKVMLGEDGDAPIDEARLVGGALFVLCDSSIPGRDDGLLSPETLAWLRGAGPGEVAFVCLHHPPVPLPRAIANPAEAEIWRRHRGASRAVAILCGMHTAAS
jgi:3',5'-cyclic AMP phosphodiesterase CpdA